MKNILLALSLVIIALGGVANVAAQSAPVPVEDMVLTIAEDDNWSFPPNADGESNEQMVEMMVNGEPQLAFAPAVLDLYERHQMIDAYAWSADLQPQYYQPISTTIEVRVLAFQTEENAVAFLGEFYDQLVELSAPEAHVAAINPLPESNLNMLGVSSMVDFTSYESGESMGSAGSARYLAQMDNTVVSVQVSGPLVDYNFDIAFWLLDAQARCIDEGTACDPIALPNGDGRWQLTEQGLMFETEGIGENVWARWIFPLEEPVTSPEWSVTIL